MGKKHQQLQRIRQAVAFNYKIFTVQQTIYLKSVKSRIFYRDTKSSSLNDAKVAPKLFFTNQRAKNICFGLWLSCSHQSSTCKPMNDILTSFMKPWKQYKLSCSSNLRFIVGSRYFVSGYFCPRQRMDWLESKEDRWKQQNWFTHKVEGRGGGDGFRRIARSTFRCIGIPLQPTLIKRRLEKTISMVSLRISFFAKQVLRYFSILWFLLLLGDNQTLSHTQKICCEQGPLLGFDTWFNCYNATAVRIDGCVSLWFELLLLWHQGVFDW